MEFFPWRKNYFEIHTFIILKHISTLNLVILCKILVLPVYGLKGNKYRRAYFIQLKNCQNFMLFLVRLSFKDVIRHFKLIRKPPNRSNHNLCEY